MRIVGKDKLDEAIKKYADTKGPLQAWMEEVKNSDWKTPQDIKNKFSTISFIQNNKALFNIKGNHYRLHVLIGYNSGTVSVKWFGTHADYDDKKF